METRRLSWPRTGPSSVNMPRRANFLKIFWRSPKLLAKSGREAQVCSLSAAVYEAQGLQSEARKQWEMAAAMDAQKLRPIQGNPNCRAQAMELLNSMQIALSPIATLSRGG